MVYRIYVERKSGFDNEAKTLQAELINILGIQGIEKIRIVNRYDAEGLTEELFNSCIKTVFSEPQTDHALFQLNTDGAFVFAVEFLPGQFDQRADSAAQCIQIISQQERPVVKSAKLYIIYGNLSENEYATIKKHVINPVECREAQLGAYTTLHMEYEIPEDVETLTDFRELDETGLKKFISTHELAMDLGDITLCQDYFRGEKRDPTITEIRVLDTYWSDHCRHTTFNTIIDNVVCEDATIKKTWNEYLKTRERLGSAKPISLMDVGTIAAKALKADGILCNLDESEEINACTVKIKVKVDGKEEDWLLLFKNETHNHPTEIEPFGGAATCIGGAIRDPLSGRGYVYAAMRLTGAADPTLPISDTLSGKLPQRTICTKSAAGYASYGNQIGLATGIVDEVYHPGYAAKRMEIGAVIAAVPAANVRRDKPQPGDVVILLGGRTGRDGMGGATGSSKSHTATSLETCGAEVQKGNAPEERKLQRLFRNPEASLLIKRCNDFGAGGISVAIGELSEGLDIDLNVVPKKYEGLDGTELAISESQERMAVVVSAKDSIRFMELAKQENLESTIVACVTDTNRLVMRWNGKKIVDISRDFLDLNGTEKHTNITINAPDDLETVVPEDFRSGIIKLASDLNVCSKRGLAERFDSTIGTGTVLMPFGGIKQLTPIQAMVHRISVEKGHTDDCSVMSWGYNPVLSEKSPYHGAYLALVEAVSKLVATGASLENTFMSFQEYFERLGDDPAKWGKPLAALLGAFKAQKGLGIAAIGGKDSMSGSFENIHVPPTLAAFAVTTTNIHNVVSPEFKKTGSRVAWLIPEIGDDGLPDLDSIKTNCKIVSRTKPAACFTPTFGGAAEAVMKMCFGNGIGFTFTNSFDIKKTFAPCYGSFIMETEEPVGVTLGYTTQEPVIRYADTVVPLDMLQEKYESRLESVYSINSGQGSGKYPAFTYSSTKQSLRKTRIVKPKALIPVFPGTNCEYDSAKALADAGADPEIFVINNLSPNLITKSEVEFAEHLRQAQIVFIPGGFSGGDEPDGSGKFITAFFRNPAVKDGIHDFLKVRDGLMLGVCNGFQALVKLGLVPFGEIIDMEESYPTLTFNSIGRHQSRLVRTRVSSNKSPWLMKTVPGDIFTVPISHGEGRFWADEKTILQLAKNGQIVTQYVDLDGNPTSDILYNPNNSIYAIEGVTSPDGRVLGKMGHTERAIAGLFQNVEGRYDMGLFRSAVAYFG